MIVTMLVRRRRVVCLRVKLLWRRGRILKRLSAASDHVSDLAFPEGAYLKGLALEIA